MRGAPESANDAAMSEPQAERPPHVFLVDANNHLFRAYHQSQNQDPRYNFRPSDGMPTGAVRIFVTKLLQFVMEGAAGIKPSHMVMTFDKGGRSTRKELYPAYKANREAPPEDLRRQLPLMRDAVRAFGLPAIELEGAEADDLIASYAVHASAAGHDVLIASADKDLMQLVGPRVRLYDSQSGVPGKPGYRPERDLDVAAVSERWEGLPPERIGDALALMGDNSDNIPGVPGFGLKTAAELLVQFGDLESLLERASEIRQPKRRETLLANLEQARISRQLVELRRDIDLPVPLEATEWKGLDPVPLIAFLKAMELPAMVTRVGKLFKVDPATVAAAEGHAAVRDVSTLTPEAKAALAPFPETPYPVLGDVEAVVRFVEEAKASGTLALQVEIEDGVPVGLGMAHAPGKAAYVGFGHRERESFFGGGEVDGQVKWAPVEALLQAALCCDGLRVVAYDCKPLHSLFDSPDYEGHARIDDVMLASYCLDSGRASHALEGICESLLGSRPPGLQDVAAAKGKQKALSECTLQAGAAYLARRADVALRAWRLLEPRLDDEGVRDVYETLELRMAPVMAAMERRGVHVDRARLAALSAEFGGTMTEVEASVLALSGERFNLGSPKQVGDYLFGKLGLPGASKTATGQWATPASILEDLAAAGHEVPARILEWRQASKLKSTYADALQTAISPRTGRVHTTFASASTTTGRLASSEPNLQNIPIRTESGRRIRKAFTASPGKAIASADYSQIELRLLAHIADIPQMRQAFADGVDIHALTASEMFGVPVEGMPSEIRRSAKAINFGIIYGVSSFGLANNLGIPVNEAGEFIKRYFERFPGIRDYMEAAKAACRRDGYVKTLYGRVCHFPGIRAQNQQERAAVERAVINAPIQGTAADIVRRAMISIDDYLDREHPDVGMLLQVHDELVFEMPPSKVDSVLPELRRIMETVADDVDVRITVPLVVEAKAAADWDSAH